MAQSLGGNESPLLGFQHRIDNGISTSMSRDKWIPTLKELSPSSFHISRGLERKVSNLIDYNQCCSREDIIRNLFLHHEVKIILRIPLKLSWTEDTLI